MKKLRKRISIISLVFILLLSMFLLCSCESDDEAAESIPVNPPILRPEIDIDEDTLSFNNINTIDDFLCMQPDKNYRLKADLDFSSVSSTIDNFSGKFDGSGYTIINVQRALFGNNSGKIYNLNIGSCNLSKAEDMMSVVCINNNGLLANISIQDAIISPSINERDLLFGAICSVNNGDVYNCYALCNINVYNPLGRLNIGLLVGENKGRIVSSYVANSSIYIEYASNKFITGDICAINSGKIINCYNAADSTISISENKCTFNNRLGLFENAVNLQGKNWCLDNLGWEDSIWRFYNDSYPLVIKDSQFDNIQTVIKRKIYPIKDGTDLVDISKDLEASYYLTSDIDLEGKEWTPLGINETNSFSGEFLGEGHVISNFQISNDNRYLGLFGYLTGKVCNLGVEKVKIISNSEQNIFVGGLAGVLDNGEITNTYVDGYINLTKFTGQTNIGMLVGMNRNGKVSYCYTTGSVASESNSNLINIGGLVGANFQNDIDFSIMNCFAVVEISAYGFYYNINPIIGYNEGTYSKLFCANNQVNVLLNEEKINLNYGMSVQIQFMYDHNWIRDAVEFDRSIWKYVESGEQTELIKLIKK